MSTALIESTKVEYTVFRTLEESQEFLSNLQADLIACDFEVASRYTAAEKEAFQATLDTLDPNSLDYHALKQRITSDGLSHPSLSRITHLSLAVSDSVAYVFIVDTPELEQYLFNWLVSTPIKQIWHNLSFDGKHILYHTGKLPSDYEDTQILAKTLLNHVQIEKALTGLKHLMAYKYGSWAISADHFDLSQMYEEHVLLYAATDACATFALWNDINSSLN